MAKATSRKAGKRASFWSRLRPARGGASGRSRGGRFLRDWGILVALVALVAGVGLYLLLRQQPAQVVTVSPYRVYFTQGDLGTQAPLGLEAEVRADIGAAQAAVELATPGLDLAGLADELIAAAARGVEVRVLQDASTQEDPAVASVADRLRAAGIPIVLHEGPGALGTTFVVVDQRVVWTGSWELSRQALSEDAAYAVRWDLPQMAASFHSEFMEMHAGRSFGPGSPANTPHPRIYLLDASSIALFMTPEDEDALAEVLQLLARVRQDIVLVAERVEDPRLGDRLIGESRRNDIALWGVLDPAGATGPVVDVLEKYASLPSYAGSGRMRENFIVVDSTGVVLFSQPLDEEALDRNDGYMIVAIDPVLGRTFSQEAIRMRQQIPPLVVTVTGPATPVPATPTP